MKRCSKCGELKLLTEYTKGRKRGSLRAVCKACDSIYRKDYYKKHKTEILERCRKYARAHPEVARRAGKKYSAKHPDRVALKGWRTNVRLHYGITAEEYLRVLEQQGGRCAICGQQPNGKRLCVDHDHKTNAIRGLLCTSCNNGLGRFRDDPALLRSAADYMERHRKT